MSKLSADSLKRQTGINDWYYNYRLDVLFILQLLFLGMSILVILSIMTRYHIISPVFVSYYAILMLFGVAAVWYFKTNYTNTSRDFYHWDKLRFPSDGNMSSNMSIELKNALTQAAASQCR